MSNNRRNLLNPERLLIASQTKARQERMEKRELIAIIEGLIEEERAFFVAIRPHVKPEGLPLLDEMIRAITPPEEARGRVQPVTHGGVQVYTERDLEKVGDG